MTICNGAFKLCILACFPNFFTPQVSERSVQTPSYLLMCLNESSGKVKYYKQSTFWPIGWLGCLAENRTNYSTPWTWEDFDNKGYIEI